MVFFIEQVWTYSNCTRKHQTNILQTTEFHDANAKF